MTRLPFYGCYKSRHKLIQLTWNNPKPTSKTKPNWGNPKGTKACWKSLRKRRKEASYISLKPPPKPKCILRDKLYSLTGASCAHALRFILPRTAKGILAVLDRGRSRIFSERFGYRPLEGHRRSTPLRRSNVGHIHQLCPLNHESDTWGETLKLKILRDLYNGGSAMSSQNIIFVATVANS